MPATQQNTFNITLPPTQPPANHFARLCNLRPVHLNNNKIMYLNTFTFQFDHAH